MANVVKQLLEFGPFRIDPEQRLLLRDERTIPLSPKAFDLLLVLTQNSGQIVLKDDLMKTLWPDTFVEESNLGQQVFQIRKALGESAQDSSYIVTVPGRGYRFAQKVRMIPAEEIREEEDLVVEGHSRSRLVIAEQSVATTVAAPAAKWRLARVLASALLALVAAAATYFFTHRAPKLTSKDTVVLADFVNSTGDPVFDGALPLALSAQLEQSPFLNLLSDRRVGQTLSLMAQPRDAHLTPELAREVCQRTASAAVLSASITQVGAPYLLNLKAINCATGESLASAQADAVDKNHVLEALGKIAAETRAKLGESLASVAKYDVAPEDVTTPSLEALKAYSLGMAARKHGLEPSVPLFERAIALDPNFAMAYAQLGVVFFNLDDTAKAADYIRKAYELRERVSDREKFYISSHYEDMVTRDLEASRKIYDVWQRIYPRDGVAFNNMGIIALYLGDWDEVLAMSLKSMELNQRKIDPNYVNAYTYVNRLDEARKMAVEGIPTDATLYVPKLYMIDFLQRDTAAMQRDADQMRGKPGFEISLAYVETITATYFGKLSEARDLTARLVDAVERIDSKPAAAMYRANAAVQEAVAGNSSLAAQQAKAALAESNAREVEAIAAVALAQTGDAVGALKLADILDKNYPKDTVIRMNFSPTIHAVVALKAKDASKAIQVLNAALPYELGYTDLSIGFCLYPIYFRGEAYLMAKQGTAAAAEFQKIVDHPGVVQAEMIGPLAHLGLGRAYVLSGDSAKAKAEYQNFLALWKDADADLPILKQAREEYTKLR